MKFSIVTPTWQQLKLLQKQKEAWECQPLRDFEWIVSSDGEETDVENWCVERGIKYAQHSKDGFNYAKTVNDGVRMAEGEYIVVVNGDSYPEPDFLEKLTPALNSDRIISTIRVNVDENGNVIKPDWRIDRVIFNLEEDVINIFNPQPWSLMTGNGMCVNRKTFWNLGGLYEEYRGGREDWDFFMHAYYAGLTLSWVPKAKILHLYHGETTDTPENLELFQRRFDALEKVKFERLDRIEDKKDQIMDLGRAREKEKYRQKHLLEIKTNEAEMEKEDAI